MIKVYEEMIKSLEHMRSLAESFEKEILSLPPGSLSVSIQSSKQYYYHNYSADGKKQKRYLNPDSKYDQRLLKKLQRRRFLQKSLSVLKTDISALEQAIAKFVLYDPGRICTQLTSAYQDIQKDPGLWLPAEPDLRRWAKESYTQYAGHPEGLIHETSTGLLVRSKSESMIADTLTLYGVPFRYEQVLIINGKSYAPDFTLLHPLNREIFYWEHFGKMDQPDYLLSAGAKIMDYRQAGIRTGTNFIMTFEDLQNPLTMREIQDVVTSRLLTR
ncbi:hypothetical protein P0G10_10360 [Eubacteriales bacterium DFI.9.88]|nr:hypothetical protein [Eubacteriales bacterium DFI.9.88]